MVTETEIAARAVEIRDNTHPAPSCATGRDCGYVKAYYKQFSNGEIPLGSLMVSKFPSGIAGDYRIISDLYHDAAILKVRLSSLQLLENNDDYTSFRLTRRGVALGQILNNESTISGAEAL